MARHGAAGECRRMHIDCIAENFCWVDELDLIAHCGKFVHAFFFGGTRPPQTLHHFVLSVTTPGTPDCPSTVTL